MILVAYRRHLRVLFAYFYLNIEMFQRAINRNVFQKQSSARTNNYKYHEIEFKTLIQVIACSAYDTHFEKF